MKVAFIDHKLENWYAIIGTDNVQQFYLEAEGCACLYDDGYAAMSKPILFGTTFPDWLQPVMGTLIFVGPPDEEGATTDLSEKSIELLQSAFSAAKIKCYYGAA